MSASSARPATWQRGITGPLAQEERPSAQVTLTREDVVRSDRGDELAAIVEDVLERRLASFVVAMEGRFAQVAIADVMQPLVIEGLNKVQGETHAALKSFDHARHSMMNKYDSTDALLRQQNADLREEVRRLREVATSLDAAKVSQRLGEIVETLRDLKPRN